MSGPEPKQYTAWEIARLAALVAKGVKTGPTGKLDRQIEAVKAAACERERIADAARARVAAEREAARFEAAVEKAARKHR
ncbi:hypothetical protein OG594_46980 [Streptomyces sp. NBC_01214]|uniref:hypothetical protein n=1 Tax=Streptomyces sp. NBC_01214 TaxID=2903777 RepID=UPI0022523D35|nr:hypothetical protein [Streptomyces sp. NBC_01214]MCX4809002.1 hypothetical protein [Streptomyces sp. NBC_01214]